MSVSESTLTRPPIKPAGSQLPSVLAIVVTHDGRRWLKSSLVALANQSYPLLDVLVVDDASPDWRADPPLRRLAKRHLRRRRWGWLRTPRPLGFGGAINWALARVRTDADLLMFLHDDARLGRDSLERMVDRLRADEEAAIVGPKVLAWDDPDRLEAVGLARGLRNSRFRPTRYYIRRNRLRAVTKNASGLRLIALVPQFVALSLLEMVAFVVLRQPGEIVNLARALAWNLLRLPQTLTERRRVQRARELPDRRLRRLTVKESTRIRF